MDRNCTLFPKMRDFFGSLSARRAWIEIPEEVESYEEQTVALRKESVDRNNVSANYHIGVRKVALRKESVDRNADEMSS